MNQPRMIFTFAAICLLAIAASAQTQRRPIRIFLNVTEMNLDKASTVATNTLSEKLAAAGFRVTTKKNEAAFVIEGSFSSRLTPVTDEVKREGGVNAEASASLRLMAGNDVIATSVERSAPGDWGIQAERIGEDRLIEVANRVADELFAGDFVQEVSGKTEPATTAKPESKSAPPRPAPRKSAAPKRGVSFLEVVKLVENYTPEDRIIAALQRYGIKFKPRDSALSQLRSLGASETVINAIKSSNVV